MRSSNGGLAYGTSGNPQTRVMQETYAAKVADNEAKLKELAPQPMIDEALVTELERDGVKFTHKDMLFVTRDKTGQIVWLEKGNAGSGMEHIKSRGHDEQIAKAFGVPKTEVVAYLRKVISQGSIVRNDLKPIQSQRPTRSAGLFPPALRQIAMQHLILLTQRLFSLAPMNSKRAEK